MKFKENQKFIAEKMKKEGKFNKPIAPVVKKKKKVVPPPGKGDAKASAGGKKK